MDVDQETKAAKRLKMWGLLIAVVSLVFVTVSFLLSLFGYAEFHGMNWLKNLVGTVYSHTQFPVLSSIWELAAQADLNEPLSLNNLWFFGEILVGLVGAGMVATANKTLADIAQADHDATQERRKEQKKKQQEDKLKEQQRAKDKDLS
ncbi:hypothetical protein HV782_009860 [Pseudomonas monsensis]|uniref:hypothetical protein n=1 Tax=Pseudomonas monsensis TaxID=2745509 RepID=UPI001648B7CA|nr:hypothetical protein [Pseudomonas monsensis]QXI02282.1 hypothetical protein HV782_009860 [Pseudomonas monsensis]